MMGAAAVTATFGYFTFRLWGHVFLLRMPQHLFGCGNFMNMPGKCPAYFPDAYRFCGNSGRIISGSRDDVKPETM
jgi:hypothetical protein